MISIGASWNSANRDNTLSWLRGAAKRLARDSLRQGVNPTLRQAIAEFLRRLAHEDANLSSSDRIESALGAYVNLRRQLGRNVVAAPPIDIAIPSVIDDSKAERVEIAKSEWPRILNACERRLAPSHALYDAIHAWATWSRSAPDTLPELLDDSAEADPHGPPTTPTAIAYHRARRLAAWANDRLIALRATVAVAGLLPSVGEAPASNGAGAAAGAPPAPALPDSAATIAAARKKDDSHIGTWILVVVVGYIAWKKTRGRKSLTA